MKKYCPKCDTWKALAEFGKNRAKKDGRQTYCRPCHNTHTRQWQKANQDKMLALWKRARVRRHGPRRAYAKQYHAQHRERLLAKKRARYQANIDQERDRSRAWCRAHPAEAQRRNQRYKAAHADRLQIAKRGYYANTPAYRQQAVERAAGWRTNNLEHYHRLHRVQQARRRARKVFNGGSFTLEQWDTLCAFYDERCLACGEQKPLEPDHIVPITQGGSSDIGNIQPLCHRCNVRKRDRTINYRRPELEGLVDVVC